MQEVLQKDLNLDWFPVLELVLVVLQEREVLVLILERMEREWQKGGERNWVWVQLPNWIGRELRNLLLLLKVSLCN